MKFKARYLAEFVVYSFGECNAVYSFEHPATMPAAGVLRMIMKKTGGNSQ